MIGNSTPAGNAPGAVPDNPVIDCWDNPYELAGVWADRTRWPLLVDDRTVVTELTELTVMSTLGDWLRRWLPIHIHYALLRGASVPAVAAAAGVPTTQLRGLWEPWADGQVDLWATSNPARRTGLSPTERNHVHAVLDAHREGVTR